MQRNPPSYSRCSGGLRLRLIRPTRCHPNPSQLVVRRARSLIRRLSDRGIDGQRRSGDTPGFIGRQRHHATGAARRPQIQVELAELRIDDRSLDDNKAAARAVVHLIAAGLHRCQLVRYGRDHPQREGGVRQMPLIVPEPFIVGGGLVAAELGADGGVEQFGQVVRDFDVRPKTEEDIAALASLILLAPNPAVAEIRDGADAVIERNSLLAVGLIRAALARRLAHLDVGQRQVVAIEQLGDFGSGGQRLVLGAAIVDGLCAQRLDTHLELVERSEIGGLVH